MDRPFVLPGAYDALSAKLIERQGFEGFVMLNLFSYRATSPADMLSHADPTGDPHNREAITGVCSQAGLVVACWGNDGRHMERSTHVKSMLQGIPLACLHINKTGAPKHPLYHKKRITRADLTVFK